MVFGASVDKAYAELLKNKKAKLLLLRLWTPGTDTLHVDLKPVLWTGKNGIYGWNYIGAETGREDVTNIVGKNKYFYDSLSYAVVPEVYKAGYQEYQKIRPQLKGKIEDMRDFIGSSEEANGIISGIVKKIGKENPLQEDF